MLNERSASTAGPHQRSVLVVEADPALRAMLSLLLETHDFAVATAKHGEAALGEIRRRQPDVIVLDPSSVGTDGRRVLDWLSDESSAAGIPVVAVSAREHAPAARAGTISAFLSMPFDVPTLLLSLNDALYTRGTI